MKQLTLHLKKYLNEETGWFRWKRIKAIRVFVLIHVALSLPLVFLICFFKRYIFNPRLNHVHIIQFDYGMLFVFFFGSLIALILMWMSSLNILVSIFCSEKWRLYCTQNKRHYYNRFFFHIFKKDRVKQMWLEWGLWLLLLLFSLIMMKSPESLQVNVNKKIMEHYGYTYCRNYYPEFGGAMELVFAREKKFCEEKP